MRQVKPARVFLLCAVVLGMLVAVATISQMVFLSKAVDRVFMGGEGLGGVRSLLLLLLGAIVLRSGLLWLREIVAQRGAVRVKNELREHLFAHLMRLGAGYDAGARYAGDHTPPRPQVADGRGAEPDAGDALSPLG